MIGTESCRVRIELSDATSSFKGHGRGAARPGKIRVGVGLRSKLVFLSLCMCNGAGVARSAREVLMNVLYLHVRTAKGMRLGVVTRARSSSDWEKLDDGYIERTEKTRPQMRSRPDTQHVKVAPEREFISLTPKYQASRIDATGCGSLLATCIVEGEFS